jgi:hypothetical protein
MAIKEIKIFPETEANTFKTNFEQRNHDEMRSNLLTNISIWLISLILIFIMTSVIMGLTTWSAIITLVVWLGAIGYFIETFSITVPALQVWVATDYFRKDPEKKLVVYRTGFHLKKPWHTVDESNKIDLRKQITVASMDGWGCTSQNGSFLKTTFNLSHSPAEEFATDYIRWPEKVREIKIRTAVEEILSTKYAVRSADDIIEHQDDIKKEASKIFGGDDQLSELEKTLGIRILGPTISAIKMDEETQKAKSASLKVTALVDSVKTLVGASDGTINSKEAADIASVVMGFSTRSHVKVEYDIKGADNATSLWLGGGIPGAPIVPTEKKEKGK